MNNLTNKIVILATFLFAQTILAQIIDPEIVDVQYSGNGCPSESASVVLSPDSKVLSILFDNYSASVGGGSKIPSLLKKCQLTIGVKVPHGKRVLIEKFDYRGYAMIPAMAQARFKSTYFYEYKRIGKKTYPLSKQKTLLFEMDDDFLIEQKVAEVFAWSQCSESFNLNITSEIEVKTNRFGDEVFISIDSFDSALDSGLNYHLTWEDCSNTTPPRNTNQASGNSAPTRNQLRDQARCQRTGNC